MQRIDKTRFVGIAIFIIFNIIFIIWPLWLFDFECYSFTQIEFRTGTEIRSKGREEQYCILAGI